MTDVTRYKNITVPLDTYEKITQAAATSFDIPISRSKAVSHVFELWFNATNKQPQPKQVDNVDDDSNHLNSYRYYAENRR
jgi:hypothetical protein